MLPIGPLLIIIDERLDQRDQKKSPNVNKSCPKMIPLEK